MRILLVSTYELGHQPVHVASPAAALRALGHDVECLDTSVQSWEVAAVDRADAIAFSVPMHTAMRLAVAAAASVRRRRPEVPICFYGLYAAVSSDRTVGRLTDRAIAGEYEPALVAWADALAGVGGDASPSARTGVSHHLDRGAYSLPARDLLPPLERYAHLALGGEERPVGAVEATHGCLHTCRHCPIPSVYGGRFRAVDADTVLADVEQLVELGARHITFADPDFLNAPTHSLRIVEGVHAAWPELTFDCTTKVDHIVDQPEVWPRFAAAGCVFVVSAFESLDDATLDRLDKGHTSAQAVEAIALLRRHGIEPRPSWLPFTPWTTRQQLVDLLDFTIEQDLVGNVEPVMYTIRLLLPEGSLLLDHPELQPHLGPYDHDQLTFTWSHPDPEVDALQRELAELVDERAASGASTLETFLDVNALVRGGLDRPPAAALAIGSTEGRPRLTEPWFC